MDFLYIVFSIIISVLVYYLFGQMTKSRMQKMLDKMPGPVKIPLFGTTYKIVFVPREDLWRNAKKNLAVYGPVVRSWLGTTPVVHLLSPESIEVILNNSVQINKGFVYDFVRPWLGDGLLTGAGKRWFTHRKLITPTFHFGILETFMEVFVEKSEVLVNLLESEHKGDTFDLYPYITRCTLDIICETAMGVQINAISNPNNEYVKAVYGITRATVERIIKPWLHPNFIYYNTSAGRKYMRYVTDLHNFTATVIKERKEALVTAKNSNAQNVDDKVVGRKVRKAFLDLLLEMHVGLNDVELREEVDTFMFEGHDTTTAGICWSLFLLGNHPQIQDEVFQEIQNVFKESSGKLTIADLGKLKLLERCIKEALRLYPSVPTISRKLTEDAPLGKYTIPKGCTVNLQIFLLHQDESIYPNPEKFDPDRFLPENVKYRHPYAYIPFSAGPRNCIGQKFAMYEEKTLLAYILKKYKVTSLENQKTVKPMMELILRPKNGLLVKLEPREA